MPRTHTEPSDAWTSYEDKMEQVHLAQIEVDRESAGRFWIQPKESR